MRGFETRLAKLERAGSARDDLWVFVASAPIPANDNDLTGWARSVADTLGYTRDACFIVEPGETVRELVSNQPLGRMGDEAWQAVERNLAPGSAALWVAIDGAQISVRDLAPGIEAICESMKDQLEASQ
jgi:hypothetical protein